MPSQSRWLITKCWSDDLFELTAIQWYQQHKQKIVTLILFWNVKYDFVTVQSQWHVANDMKLSKKRVTSALSVLRAKPKKRSRVIMFIHHHHLLSPILFFSILKLKFWSQQPDQLVSPDGYAIRCIHCTNLLVGIPLFNSTFVIRSTKTERRETQQNAGKIAINVQLQIFVISVSKMMIMSFDWQSSQSFKQIIISIRKNKLLSNIVRIHEKGEKKEKWTRLLAEFTVLPLLVVLALFSSTSLDRRRQSHNINSSIGYSVNINVFGCNRIKRETYKYVIFVRSLCTIIIV